MAGNSKPNPLSGNSIAQLLAAAVALEHGQHLVIVAIKDAVDGVLAGNVLDLASTEVEMAGQDGSVTVIQLGNHLLPDLLAHCGIGLLEHNLVEKTAFEGRVKVLGEVGGGNHDAVQVLHFLQDDVLHGVLHLVNSILGARLAGADEGVGFVEEQDGRQFRAFHHLAVAVEERLDVLPDFDSLVKVIL